jgi:uncharacterized membrane protein YqjE
MVDYTGDSDRISLRMSGGNGRQNADPVEEESIGDLFKRLGEDGSHLVQQEIKLAKTELKETGDRLAKTGMKLGTAIGIALPGLFAFTAFLVIALGDLIDNYWLSSLIVAVVMLGTSAVLMNRALAGLKERPVGIPETSSTLRENAQWAKEEAREFKRELTA